MHLALTTKKDPRRTTCFNIWLSRSLNLTALVGHVSSNSIPPGLIKHGIWPNVLFIIIGWFTWVDPNFIICRLLPVNEPIVSLVFITKAVLARLWAS